MISDDLDAPSGSRPRPLRRLRSTVERHPLVAIGVVAGVVALGHALWIWRYRYVGGYDPDEAGYIATSLRYQRSIDIAHPGAFVAAVGGTGTGPIVPLLGLLFLLPGPRDPRTVMLVQPLLLVVTCIGIGGITRRLAGPVAAFATGCAFLALPTASLATQSFWLGLGASAAMTLAIWALLASDRCTNRWTYAFGVALGTMALTRTMALGFVPGALLAGAVLAGSSRTSWWGLARATATAVGVAGPLFVVQRDSIFGYLVMYGYGPRAGLFGSGGPLERLEFRFDRISGDIGRSLAVTSLVIALTSVPVMLLRWRRGRVAPHAGRELLAVTTVVVAGLAALVSTTNNGVWFELPLIVLLVALAGALAARTFVILRVALAVQVIGQAVMVLAITWWLVEPGLGLTAHYENGFAQYDERFGVDRRADHRAAARDWAALSSAVEREMHAIDGGSGLGAVFDVTGNMQLFNSNSLALAAELQAWGPGIRIPDTTLSRRERAKELTPMVEARDGRVVERVLVVAIHDKILFTPDAQVDSFAAQAADAGWTTTARFAMPGGGRVMILRNEPDRTSGGRGQTNG